MKLQSLTRRRMKRNPLGSFLLDMDISFRRAADGIGDVSHVAVREWATGRGRPEDDATRMRIERWTDGKVPATVWLTPADAKRLADARAVEPFASTGTEG